MSDRRRPARPATLLLIGLLLAGALPARSAPPASPGLTRDDLVARAEAAYQRGDFGTAAERFRVAVELAPADRYHRVALVDSLHLAGRDGEAESVARRLERDFPGTAEARYLAADQSMRAGDLPAAVRAYRLALAVDPADRRARIELALALVKSGRATEGLAEAARTAREFPGAAPDACYVAALAWRLAGDYGRALPWFEAALALRPRDVFAAAEVYATLRALGRKVRPDLYFAENPGFYLRPVLDALFDVLLGGGDPAAHANRLARVDGYPQVVQPVRALLLEAAGRRVEARTVAETMLKAHPDDNLVRLAAGIAFRHASLQVAMALVRDAFRPSLYLNDPVLQLRILRRFPEGWPAGFVDGLARDLARRPAPAAPPFQVGEFLR